MRLHLLFLHRGNGNSKTQYQVTFTCGAGGVFYFIGAKAISRPAGK